MDTSNQTESLASGLYLVSTPIGCLEDITLRAIRILRCCTHILCEDTRVSQKLLKALNIDKPLFLYHDHNADRVRPKILQNIKNGESLALISDAGTPLIADPGFKLVQACYAHNLMVTIIPGPTAFIAAAILSGFPTHPLSFLGFGSNLKQKTLKIWKTSNSTLVFFEAPHKLRAFLSDLKTSFPNREIAVVREITKIHEEVIRGTFDEVIQHFSTTEPRGEIVVVLSPPFSSTVPYFENKIEEALQKALKTMTLKNAVNFVTESFSVKRRYVYQRALTLIAEKPTLP